MRKNNVHNFYSITKNVFSFFFSFPCLLPTLFLYIPWFFNTVYIVLNRYRPYLCIYFLYDNNNNIFDKQNEETNFLIIFSKKRRKVANKKIILMKRTSFQFLFSFYFIIKKNIIMNTQFLFSKYPLIYADLVKLRRRKNSLFYFRISVSLLFTKIWIE